MIVLHSVCSISALKYFSGSAVATKRDVTYTIKCAICDSVKKGKIREKSRLCERDRATLFLAALKFYNDGPSLRLAHVDNVDVLLAADIYCHKECMRNYLANYELDSKICALCKKSCRNNDNFSSLEIDSIICILDLARENQDSTTIDSIQEVFNESRQKLRAPCYVHDNCLRNYTSGAQSQGAAWCYEEWVVPLIEDMLRQKYGLKLSTIKEHLTAKRPNRTFYNHLIKSFIVETYGDQISFCKPYKKNESEVAFPSSISQAEIVQKIETHDSLTYSGKVIREALLKVDFGLQDSYCDKADLHNAYHGTDMPPELITFFSALFKIPKARLLTEKESFDGTSDVEDEEEGDTSLKDDTVASGSRYNLSLIHI